MAEFTVVARLILQDGTVQEEQHHLSFEGASNAQDTLLGTWRIEMWEEPRPRGIFARFYRPEPISGSLVVDQQLTANTYEGIMTVYVGTSKRSIVEKLEITVGDAGSVTMLGRVVANRQQWTDDKLSLEWNNDTLQGTARDRYGSRKDPVQVRFVRQ